MGRPSPGEACTIAVPARSARPRFVVNGMTRTDWRRLVSSLLCHITTGRRPVCSRGRKGPRSAHHSSPRRNYRPPARSSRSSASDHSASPCSASSRSSVSPVLANRSRSHRLGSGWRTTMSATRSPSASARGVSGLSRPSSKRASINRMASMVARSAGSLSRRRHGREPAGCPPLQGRATPGESRLRGCSRRPCARPWRCPAQGAGHPGLRDERQEVGVGAQREGSRGPVSPRLYLAGPDPRRGIVQCCPMCPMLSNVQEAIEAYLVPVPRVVSR